MTVCLMHLIWAPAGIYCGFHTNKENWLLPPMDNGERWNEAKSIEMIDEHTHCCLSVNTTSVGESYFNILQYWVTPTKNYCVT